MEMVIIIGDKVLGDNHVSNRDISNIAESFGNSN